MILIVGATGMLGGMITQQLLAQGKDVRILSATTPRQMPWPPKAWPPRPRRSSTPARSRPMAT